MVLPQEQTAAITQTSEPAAPILVGVSGTLDPSAPLPRTPAERLLAVNLYQTVVQVDCEGRVHPGLAEAWHEEEGGRVWTFQLRADARDHRGSPVTAATVASSWLRTQGAASGGGLPAAVPVRSPLPVFAGVIVRDSRTLRVELEAPVDAGRFARPELAVRTGLATTGAARTGADADGAGGVFQLAGPVRVHLRPVPPDGRDALDAGVELLATSDPRVIAYAGRLPGYRVVPLGWDRSYFLAVPAFSAEAPFVSVDGDASALMGDLILDGLIQDAVRAGARPAGGPPGPDACLRPDPAGARGTSTSGHPAPRVVYPLGDPVARGLAERLVALTLDRSPSPGGGWARAFGAGGGPVTLRAVGLDERPFLQALRSGRDAAYVVPAEGTGCPSVDAALHATPWAAPWTAPSTAPGNARDPTGPAEPGQGVLLPLIETRGSLVAAPGVGGVAVDGAGLLRLHGLGRTVPEGMR